MWMGGYLTHPEFRYVVWLRIGSYCVGRRYLFALLMLALIRLRLLRYKTGIQITPFTKIGKGLFIGHIGSIVINSAVEIGENCNIIQTCTIGVAYRKSGAPKIGDNVYIGPGSRIIGPVVIGNNVAIGANAVVTKSFPDNSVVAGVPAKLINTNGAEGYIYNYIDADGVLHPRV